MFHVLGFLEDWDNPCAVERRAGIIVNNWKHSLRVLMILQTLAIRCRLLKAGASAGTSGGDRGSGTRNTSAVFSFEKQGLLQGQV